MRVIDEALLNQFRGPGPCEWCGRRFARREPHHIFARGMGGGGRLDIRANLVALCLLCHRSAHDGNQPLRCDLLAVVAAREGLLQADIESEIRRLQRAPKQPCFKPERTTQWRRRKRKLRNRWRK